MATNSKSIDHKSIVEALLNSDTTNNNSLYPFSSKLDVIINVHPCDDSVSTRDYSITNISLNGHFKNEKTDDSYQIRDLDTMLYTYITEINEQIQNDSRQWNAFYVLKELIQKIEEFHFHHESPHHSILNKYDLFYRGQNHNYPMLPGIARTNSVDTNRISENFESIYENLSYEYPELKYISFPFSLDTDNSKEHIRDRVTQLALLQHYGFPTPLVDVTSSPFVGMFFMAHEFNSEEKYYNNNESPVLSIFLSQKGELNSLFQRAEVTPTNHRLKPQFGSFIDFEMLTLQNFDVTPPKAHAINITFEYDRTNHKNMLSKKSIRIPPTNSINFSNLMKKMFDSIRCDIDNKLGEYHYRYIDLFPDLENRASYIKNKYKPDNKDLSI
ncbi:hypothetical protein LCIT_19010 [Leuconostoc citreum]|uniref:FRG domain-containing protein n=1 Tax=Leuconostoc citreum TaxID=33964 RepID=A0A5A5U2Q9_LEUCI|nr:FRG domain-containing protein [Leuconostoc citreum]GDZ84659.1 hypothetical protein LCIT_19010 [Leuconostoc citreum]